MSSENQKATVFDVRDIIQLRIECSDGHETSIPVTQWNTEELIQKFFLGHCHLTAGSPAEMREDLKTLSQLLVRLSTADLIRITEITNRRNLKVELEISRQ